MSVSDSSDWDVGTSAFTLECFINISAISVDFSGIFGMHTGSTQFQFRINNQGRIQFLQDLVEQEVTLMIQIQLALT